MKSFTWSREEQDKTAEFLSRRLTSDDIRSVLKDIDRRQHSSKGVERIVAETENRGRLLRTRVEDEHRARLLVDVGGQDLLANRRLRYLLAFTASEPELDQLHEFPGGTRVRGVSAESLARCVANRKWHPGKRWAKYFVTVLGFPPALAGLPGTPRGPEIEDVEPHVPLPLLEEFQENLRAQVVEMLSAPPGSNRAVLTLPTGAGKTRTTIEALIDWWLADHRGDFILWVAQSDELCGQAVQAFREVWIDRGDRGVREKLRLYRFWGTSRRVPEDNGVIISTIDKLREALVERRRSGSYAVLPFCESVGAVVIDEAHRAEAPSYREVLAAVGIEFSSAAQTPVPVLGLTATPLRSQHEETVRLARRFYNRLLRPRTLPEDPADALSALRLCGVLSKPVHRVLPPVGRPIRLTKKQESHLEKWQDLPPDLLLELGQKKDRNQQLLEAIAGLDATWPVLFFGCSVQHAEAMAVLLRRRGREAAAVTAKTRETTRRQLVEAFRHGQVQVLCNYGVLTTGFDAPRVRAVVIGRPTTSRLLYEQMIGRGMRGPKFGGTEECLVIDVDDNLIHWDGSTRLTTASQRYSEYWSKQS